MAAEPPLSWPLAWSLATAGSAADTSAGRDRLAADAAASASARIRRSAAGSAAGTTFSVASIAADAAAGTTGNARLLAAGTLAPDSVIAAGSTSAGGWPTGSGHEITRGWTPAGWTCPTLGRPVTSDAAARVSNVTNACPTTPGTHRRSHGHVDSPTDVPAFLSEVGHRPVGHVQPAEMGRSRAGVSVVVESGKAPGSATPATSEPGSTGPERCVRDRSIARHAVASGDGRDQLVKG